MTKEEFIKKHIPNYSGKVVNFLSDLDTVIKSELIKYDKWCETLPTKDYSLTGNQLVKKYLRNKP